MKKQPGLSICASVVTGMLLTACSSSSGDGNSVAGDGGSTETGYTETFKGRSVGEQVEELLGGVIGIADEVGNGKMGDPMGENRGSFDTTLVESQFSWNSTMDFYNNIYSIHKVWDGGLKAIAEASQPEQAATITVEIADAQKLITDISDSDGNGTLETSDLIANNGALSFRQQIQSADGRSKIELAQAKLADLQGHLETLKAGIAPTDAEKNLAAGVVDNVIVKGYNDLATEAGTLLEKLKALTENPSADSVEEARTQWRAARAPWEAGEGHIFGPVDTLGVDPKVDSWPVDKSQLDGALGGYDPALANIDGFPVTMKGFHAIEYLLFGDGATLEPAAMTAERLQTPAGDEGAADKLRLNYLQALGESFNKDIQALASAW